MTQENYELAKDIQLEINEIKYAIESVKCDGFYTTPRSFVASIIEMGLARIQELQKQFEQL